jgi:hypothetical protein
MSFPFHTSCLCKFPLDLAVPRSTPARISLYIPRTKFILGMVVMFFCTQNIPVYMQCKCSELFFFFFGGINHGRWHLCGNEACRVMQDVSNIFFSTSYSHCHGLGKVARQRGVRMRKGKAPTTLGCRV